MRNGQYAEAMSRIDAALTSKPNDPRLRFSKGMLLAQQNKSTEAIAVLLKLTEDFPDLPEPYNNLAVLYAANGQYESARIALDKAIANNPSYGTAYENLGDVYAELARQSYDKAVKMDAANTTAKTKMARLGGAPAVTQVAHSAPAAKPAAVAVNPAPTPTSVKPVGEKTPIDKSAEKTLAADAGKHGQDDVLAAVRTWARAWSARDMKAYLGAYSDDFKTPRGLTHEAWVNERTARITGKKQIRVDIEAPEVRMDGDSATVSFRQLFKSDRLTATDRKTLVLVKRDGQWRIREERAS
ncbi:L,D-transpeptidase Cds6 family protein [Noviherbaspirillum pedocola]|uniref:Tetratricopeptide repeat protein n=1 Tax=Noviherbaspirillum pedocola TaxID=2801341 RepID=A0A934SXG9_9BURK|nr:tetratricopeptide repeat protein [Noviherbaspirillum pedocola]MBK4737464.1 tetratricopeptide repeat protein [Noviherbaspirillum pedocola]